MFIDYDKAGNRQVLKQLGHIKITGWVYGYNEISKERFYKIEVSGAYHSRQELQKAKNFVFEIAKIAHSTVYCVSDTEISLALPMRFEYNRKETREKLEQIHNLVRNYQ